MKLTNNRASTVVDALFSFLVSVFRPPIEYFSNYGSGIDASLSPVLNDRGDRDLRIFVWRVRGKPGV